MNRLGALGLLCLLCAGCTERALGWLAGAAPVDAGVHDLARPHRTFTCDHPPVPLADDVDNGMLALAISDGEILYMSHAGPVANFSSDLTARSIAGGTTRSLGEYDVQWVTAYKHHAFFVEQRTVIGQPFAIRDIDLQTGATTIIDHTENIGQVAVNDDTLLIVTTSLHRLDRKTGIARDLPLPFVDNGGSSSTVSAFGSWIPILADDQSLWSYDVAKDAFSVVVPGAMTVNSVAAAGAELFVHAFFPMSFYPLSPAGLGAPIPGGYDFSFAFDADAIYSIELTTPGVRMTPRDGSPACTISLDPSLRDVIVIDDDAVYVLVDAPMQDAGGIPASRLLRIMK